MLDGEIASTVARDLLRDLLRYMRCVRVDHKVDESRWRLRLVGVPTATDDQHLTDVCVLGHVDALGIVRTDDRVNVEPIREVLAQRQIGWRCRHDAWQYQCERA